MSITVGLKKFTVSTKMSPVLRESRFLNLGNFLPVESGIPETISTYKESGIQCLESEFHGVESILLDCLLFPFRG